MSKIQFYKGYKINQLETVFTKQLYGFDNVYYDNENYVNFPFTHLILFLNESIKKEEFKEFALKLFLNYKIKIFEFKEKDLILSYEESLKIYKTIENFFAIIYEHGTPDQDYLYIANSVLSLKNNFLLFSLKKLKEIPFHWNYLHV